MALRPPPLKAPVQEIADWCELYVLCSPNRFLRLGSLKRDWDTKRESEDADPEGRESDEESTLDGVSGPDADRFLDAVVEELGDRIDALDDSYPFHFTNEGQRFELVERWGDGAVVYLFCLLLSAYGADELFDEKLGDRLTNNVRNLFQGCSTLAAAGELLGCSIAFGWPRPNANPPFLAKLKEVYGAFEEGVVVEQPPPVASPQVKDEEIDIIAWKPRRDRAPGTAYMLAQVASGENWYGKSIKGGPIDYFHRTWFVRPPASLPNPALFVPRNVHQNRATRRESLDFLTAKFGTIFDRLRVPGLASHGIQHAADNPNFIVERQADIEEVRIWVAAQLDDLRQKPLTAL